MRLLLSFVTLLYILPLHAMAPRIKIDKAIDQAVSKYSPSALPHLNQYFDAANVHYPPKDIALLAFKKEKKIELWAQDESSIWILVHSFPLTAASGNLGPKLKEFDRQIPEGIYHLVSFNPFSSMHLSLMVDYPNEFDLTHAKLDGRKNLGDNIFLHGDKLSVGCLAVGDKAIEELFILSRHVGLDHINLIISPNDMRKHRMPLLAKNHPKWTTKLYSRIKRALKPYRKKAL